LSAFKKENKKKRKKEKEKNKVWNDKYSFEACTTEHYPLRYVLLVLPFEVILLLGKLASPVNKLIM